MNDLTRVLLQEREVYCDPFTEFLMSLYVDFDFDRAQELLRICEQLMFHDYFLQDVSDAPDEFSLKSMFLAAARQLMFECCCRIHKRMDIDTLCERLEISEDKESRIVHMVQESGLEVKIDSLKNQMNMTKNFPSIYSKVLDLERLKTLASRSEQLARQIELKYGRMENE